MFHCIGYFKSSIFDNVLYIYQIILCFFSTSSTKHNKTGLVHLTCMFCVVFAIIGVTVSKNQEEYWDTGFSVALDSSCCGIIAIFVFIIPAYFFTWVLSVGCIVQDYFGCKYWVLSIPIRLYKHMQSL